MFEACKTILKRLESPNQGKNFHHNRQCVKAERLIDAKDMVKKKAIDYSEKTILSLCMMPKVFMKRQQFHGLKNTSVQSGE